MTERVHGVKFLRTFAAVWIVLFLLVWVVSAGFHIAAAASVWSGISDVLWWVAPWNVASYLVNVVSLLPAIGAHVWAQRLEAKGRSTTNPTSITDHK